METPAMIAVTNALRVPQFFCLKTASPLQLSHQSSSTTAGARNIYLYQLHCGLRLVRHSTADRMAAHRKLDRRRDDLCAGGLRKGARGHLTPGQAYEEAD